MINIKKITGCKVGKLLEDEVGEVVTGFAVIGDTDTGVAVVGFAEAGAALGFCDTGIEKGAALGIAIEILGALVPGCKVGKLLEDEVGEVVTGFAVTGDTDTGVAVVGFAETGALGFCDTGIEEGAALGIAIGLLGALVPLTVKFPEQNPQPQLQQVFQGVQEPQGHVKPVIVGHNAPRTKVFCNNITKAKTK